MIETVGEIAGTNSVQKFSPVRRLAKGYANQGKDGSHMVDLIDSANGYVIARCVYEQYADEIIATVRAHLGAHP